MLTLFSYRTSMTQLQTKTEGETGKLHILTYDLTTACVELQVQSSLLEHTDAAQAAEAKETLLVQGPRVDAASSIWPGGNVRATGQNWRIDASLLRVVMIWTSPQKDRQVAPGSGRPVEELGIAVK
ncbi:hypothetical protein CGCVW01_v010960 [Colletotrichum viniferum]|nr:hypothetical protein CGCVW01_v010960 [Colletotrichum viniferum]